MAERNAQSLACSCSPGPLWVKAEGIEEVFNSHRSNERTFVQSNPIAFPGINAPEGLFHSPCGPKNVAREVQAWWKQCKEWMAHFKGQSAPLVFDFKSLLKALSGKEAEAQSEVDAFMEHCAKRWQTREGTYQLKRRRLKPDVRDPPEEISADVDMADI